VHTHARPFATTLACLDRGIPPFHYMSRALVAATSAARRTRHSARRNSPTTRMRALEGRRACLLAHHGMIAVDASLESALELAVEFETLAEMYWRALQVGEPALLSDAEMATVLEKFRTYGQPRPGA